LSFNGDQYSSDEGLDLLNAGDIHTRNASDNTALPIGSNSHILSVDTSEATKLAWVANTDAGLTLGTKGDIHTRNATNNVALAVGSNLKSLYANSAESTGLEWNTNARETLATTGDILSASSANTLSAISPSTSGHVLTSNGATTLPSFQAVSSGTQTFEKLGSVTLTSGSSMTFTPSSPYDQDDYEQFLIVTRGATTHATRVYAEINSMGNNYHWYQQESNGSSVTETWDSGNNELTMSTTNITVGGEAYVSKLWLTLPQDNDEQYLMYQLDPTMRFGSSATWYQMWGSNTNTVSEINKIAINVSANAWVAGSTIVVYGVNNT
jgi:hypothetical protein